MGFQYDVKAKNMVATGASGIGTPRARVKGIYAVLGTLAGSLSFRDGGAAATELIKLDTPANTTGSGYIYIIVPNDGVRFEADPYVTLTNVTSVTFFYG